MAAYEAVVDAEQRIRKSADEAMARLSARDGQLSKLQHTLDALAEGSDRAERLRQ